MAPPNLPESTADDFHRLDIRVGRILEAWALEGARRPAIAMRVDFGSQIGVRQSSAQITEVYTPASLLGRLVLGVVNLPPRRVAGFRSEALVLGVYSQGGAGPVVLIVPGTEGPAEPGDRVG